MVLSTDFRDQFGHCLFVLNRRATAMEFRDAEQRLTWIASSSFRSSINLIWHRRAVSIYEKQEQGERERERKRNENVSRYRTTWNQRSPRGLLMEEEEKREKNLQSFLHVSKHLQIDFFVCSSSSMGFSMSSASWSKRRDWVKDNIHCLRSGLCIWRCVRFVTLTNIKNEHDDDVVVVAVMYILSFFLLSFFQQIQASFVAFIEWIQKSDEGGGERKS